MITVGLIILGVFGYMCVGGLLYQPILDSLVRACAFSGHDYEVVRCKNSPEGIQTRPCKFAHKDAAAAGAVFWIVAAPILLGKGRVSKEDKVKTKEIADAKHRAKLAKIAADEAESLDRQLKAARR